MDPPVSLSRDYGTQQGTGWGQVRARGGVNVPRDKWVEHEESTCAQLSWRVVQQKMLSLLQVIASIDKLLHTFAKGNKKPSRNSPLKNSKIAL